VVSKDSVFRTAGFLRTPLRRPVLWACLLFVPLMAAVLSFGLWVGSIDHYLTPVVEIVLIAFVAPLIAGVVWMVGVGLTSIGVAVEDGGLVVFERVIPRGKALRRVLTWESIRNLRVSGSGV